MQAGLLLATYILITVVLQAIGFGVSQLVHMRWPAVSTIAFLILFLGAFALAWPIAVRVAEVLIRRAGYVVETEQSGGASRTDHLRPRR
jgi:hypothetical protein